MDYQAQGAGAQAGAYSRFACAGCGALTARTGCSTLRSKRKPRGWYAFVCHACSARAHLSPKFRRQIEMAAGAGIPLSELQRVYAQLGCDVPTLPHEFDAALRLPPGSAATMFGGA
ncbi:hypothetical protein [Rhizobacter fulvus]